MREMKDSGIPWIGEIPKEWELKKIKYCLLERIEKNYPVKTTDILSLTAKQGVVPYDQKEGGGNKPKEDVSAYRLAYPGDIVMNSMNILSGSVGLSAYFGCVSPVYYMLRPSDKTEDVRFYNYIFQTTAFQRSLYGLGNGILIKESGNGKLNTIRMRIPMEKFGQLSIPIAPSKKQQKISDFLDRKCREIDALAAEIEKQIETLEDYKRSVITEAVTKGLNPAAEMKPSGMEWIGEIPSLWNLAHLRNIIIRRDSGAWGTEYDEENGTICLRVADFDYGKGIFKNTPVENLTWRKYDPAQVNLLKLEKNDILIEKSGGGEKTPVGRTVIFEKNYEAVFANFLERIRVNRDVANPLFVEYWLRALYFCRVTPFYINQTTGIQNLNLSLFLAKEKIALPSISEQVQISDFLDDKCAEIDGIVADKKSQLGILSDYKKSLIYEYVTGKKEVPQS